MAAREHPRYANTEFDDYEFREFPMMVYPGAADQKKPYGKDGKPLAGIIVNNEDEYRQALNPEGEATETVVEKGQTRLKTPEDARKELLEAAEVAGVQVDKKWSAARIQDAIDSAAAGKDVV